MNYLATSSLFAMFVLVGGSLRIRRLQFLEAVFRQAEEEAGLQRHMKRYEPACSRSCAIICISCVSRFTARICNPRSPVNIASLWASFTF